MMLVFRMLSFYNGMKVKSVGECSLQIENPRTGVVYFENFVVVKDGIAALLPGS